MEIKEILNRIKWFEAKYKEDLEEKDRIKKKETIYRIAFYLGEIFLRNGGQTHKLESMVYELCKSQGFPHANMYVTPTFLCIGDDRADGITFIKSIKVRGLNLKRVSLINDYYEDLLLREHINPKKALKILKRIDRYVEFSDGQGILSLGLAAATFAKLLDITMMEGVITFVITIISTYISNKFGKILTAGIFGTIIGCFFIGISSFFLAEYGYITSSHKIIIGSILPFLPGVAITKSIIDLVYGDYISGGCRAIEAFLTALSIGVGIGTAMDFWVKIGGRI